MSSSASTSTMAAGSSSVASSRWYPVGKEDSTKPVNVGRGKMTAMVSEELDLRLENERKLHEMREQGKQILLQSREGQGLAEEGAANLLARFHNLHWKRQHHLDSSSQCTSQQPSREARENTKVLVPFKHDENDYFPGTRQPKKVKNQKIFKKKNEVLQLEEVEPVNKNILPAGYPPCTSVPNAWSLRKGTDLFDHCKINLTIHGPDDEVLQRAVEESLITLREEQNRIVNMFSDSCSEERKEKKVWNPLPNEMVDSWSDPPTSATGAGDGAWLQGKARSSQVSAVRSQFANSVADETSNPHSNYGANLPENSSYNDRGRAMLNRLQNSSRMMNGTGGSSPTRGNDRKNSESKERRQGTDVYGSGRNSTETRSVRSGGGDGHYNSSKEKETANGAWESRNDESLESLGFGRTRNATQKRSSFRGRQDFKPNYFQRGASSQDDERKKTDTMADLPQNRRPRHISFSEPLVQNGNPRRRGSVIPPPEEDSDPWLENDDEKIYPPQVTGDFSSWNKRKELENARSIMKVPNDSSLGHTWKESENARTSTKDGLKVFPQRIYKPSYNSSTTDRVGVKNVQKELEAANEDEVKNEKNSEDARKKLCRQMNLSIRRPVVLVEEASSTSAETSAEQEKKARVSVEPAESTTSSDVPCSTKSKSEVESEEIKRMREQIEMLDHKLRSISCALEETSASSSKPVLKAHTLASVELTAGMTASGQSGDAGSSKAPLPAQVDPAGMEAYVAQLHQRQLVQQQLAQHQQLVQQQQQRLLQHQQLTQQQILLQGAAPATSCPSAFPHPLTLGWMSQGGSNQVPPGTPSAEWIVQMGAAIHGTTAATSPNFISGQQTQDAQPVPQTTASSTSQTNAPNAGQSAAGAVPLGAVGGPQNVATQAQWLTQYSVWQQQEQQRMAHILAQGLVPGMVMPSPQIQVPLPQQPMRCPTAGVGVGWPVGNAASSQFEGDWMISPSDQARLEQGRTLNHSEENAEDNSDSPSDSSPSKCQNQSSNSGAQETFPDPALNPTGSVRALGLPLPSALKPARPPAHLAGLKNPGPRPQASGSGSSSPPLDLSAFNPSMPPPEVPVMKGVRGGSNTQLDEPRGRGRLR